ncbi:MAG: hypothetical protein Q9162_000337 [Coniocarpon cinnabarinum]
MAEAFGALAVISSVITCIEFAGKLMAERIKFTKSSSSVLADNIRLQEFGQENERIASQLDSRRDNSTGQTLEQDVHERARECQHEYQVLNSLYFPNINKRRYDLGDAAPETFQWSLTKSPLPKWLREGSGVFWIHGKAGSGKSTMMKHILGDSKTTTLLSEWANGKRLVVADHFFSMLSSSMQRSYQGLLQTLLYKILANNRSLVPVGCPHRCDPNATRSKSSWSTRELFDCLSAIIGGSDAFYCFFIDGLDEYHPQDEHVKLVERLVEITSKPNAKMCVSSRTWSVFENAFGQKSDQITLESWTRDDIGEYVSSTLLASARTAVQHDFEKHNYAFTQFVEEFLDKADGVFIWAHLITSSMCDRVLAGKDLLDLRRCLDELPGELEQYLRKLVYDRINSTWQNGKKSETATALKLAMVSHLHFNAMMPMNNLPLY